VAKTKTDPTAAIRAMDDRLGITRLTEWTEPGRLPLKSGRPCTVSNKGFGKKRFTVRDITISQGGAVSVNVVTIDANPKDEAGFFSFRPKFVRAVRGS
jgi:hypothetical protein